MSALGDVIRDNADLHRLIHRVISDLAAHHMAQKTPGHGHLLYLCEASARILPHLPEPPKEA